MTPFADGSTDSLGREDARGMPFLPARSAFSPDRPIDGVRPYRRVDWRMVAQRRAPEMARYTSASERPQAKIRLPGRLMGVIAPRAQFSGRV